MDVMAFFSDLILITAGLIVLLFWLVIFAVVAIELFDLITGNGSNDIEEEDL
jgi:hypothetical protein